MYAVVIQKNLTWDNVHSKIRYPNSSEIINYFVAKDLIII